MTFCALVPHSMQQVPFLLFFAPVPQSSRVCQWTHLLLMPQEQSQARLQTIFKCFTNSQRTVWYEYFFPNGILPFQVCTKIDMQVMNKVIDDPQPPLQCLDSNEHAYLSIIKLSETDLCRFISWGFDEMKDWAFFLCADRSLSTCWTWNLDRRF